MKRLIFIALILLFTTSTVTVFAMEENQPAMTTAKQAPDIEHPIKKPKMYSKTKRYPNCGMMINM